ncbi:MAG: hypothetical protein FD149_1578 [Rhodospirillaceae bacterium]|nr:MAG: hypothetical protein FD149_1578 [Rhodospirillaceae bacterium]
MVLKFLKRKTARLKKLLGFEQPPPPPSGAGKKREDWFEGVSQTIENILKEEAARFGANKIHIISLTDFRTALGTRWQRLSLKVMLIGESVIQRHIGPGHLYSRQGEDTFLLVFRNIPPHEAHRRTVLIANDLGHRLVGAAFSDLSAQIRIAEINAAQLLTPEGTIDGTVLATVAATGTTVDLTRPDTAPVSARSSEELNVPSAGARHSSAPLASAASTSDKAPQWNAFGIEQQSAEHSPKLAVLDHAHVRQTPDTPAETPTAPAAKPTGAAEWQPMNRKEENHSGRKDKNVLWQPLASARKTGDSGPQIIAITHKASSLASAGDPRGRPFPAPRSPPARRRCQWPNRQGATARRSRWRRSTDPFGTERLRPSTAISACP